MYNPLIDKKPYGATAVGKETIIRFPLDSSSGVKRVFVVLRHIFGEGGEQNKEAIKVELPLQIISNDEYIFEGKIVLNDYGIYNYRFEGELENGDLAFFGRNFDGTAIRGDWLPEWQLTVSKVEYKTPDWAKSGVIYQIFADRFCRKDPIVFNKHGRLHSSWSDIPDIQEEGKDYRADDYFGGNIRGIISKLDYIKSLGVTSIYLSPIFESYSNHRYDTGDYLKIDELFGTEEEFKDLINKANALGINIILDGVFNHTGSDSIYFNREGRYESIGAYQSEKSKYYDWYTFYDFPNEYNCWWGSTVVPTVNKNAKGYKELILGKDGVINKWSSIGVKGWRLDVVDELPIDFTTELCKVIKNAGNDMFVIGEVWEDASTKISYSEWRPYFMGEQLDSVMNYPFKEAIIDYVLTNNKKDFVLKISKIMENYPKETLDVLMNLLDSHDTVRALTKLSNIKAPLSKRERADFVLSKEAYEEAVKRLKLASLIQYVLPGVPCVFYGDEVGMEGFEDPLNRGTYPWGKENKELLSHYLELGKFRNQYSELLKGETIIKIENEDVVIYRISNGEMLEIIINPNGVNTIEEDNLIYTLDNRVKIYKKKHS